MEFSRLKRAALSAAALVAAASFFGMTPVRAIADQFIGQYQSQGGDTGIYYFQHCEEDGYDGYGCAMFAFPYSAGSTAYGDLYYNSAGYYWWSWVQESMSNCISNAQNAGLPMTVSAGIQDNHYEWDTTYTESAHGSGPGIQNGSSVCAGGVAYTHDNYRDPVNEGQDGGWTDDPNTYQSYTYGIADFNIGNG